MRSLLPRSFVASATIALGAASAQTTLHVPADHATIQAAIAAAIDGDTVLVAPGTYVEELDYLGKAITVASSHGAGVTILSNVNSAVSFVNGEGPGSVLRGFKVTGNSSSRAAIHGPGTRPRILQCEIRGNHTSTALAAGVVCDGTLVDCRIVSNSNGNGTAGAAGALVLRRCVLEGNSGYDAAAAWLFGGRMEDCVVRDNGSAEGSNGGAVAISSAYPVTLERCLFTNNWKSTWSGMYSARGAALTVHSPTAAAELVNCTIVANRVDTPGIFGPDVGGVYGLVTLTNCILRENDGEEFEAGATSATYSNVEGGLAGKGNFDANPRFRYIPGGDYRLLPGSPCIDTGDPAAPLDPDGSRADVGALSFTHATASLVNGSGANPLLFSAFTPPVIGKTWQVAIQASLVPRTIRSGFQVRTGLNPAPQMTSVGEFLLTGNLLGWVQVFSNGTRDTLSSPIPANSSLLGLRVYAQAYVITGPIGSGGVRLGNGLALLIGE
jgi:hypothetical protein